MLWGGLNGKVTHLGARPLIAVRDVPHSHQVASDAGPGTGAGTGPDWDESWAQS